MALEESSKLSIATVILVAVISSFSAVVLVLILVLPAAYGVDPTGLGGKLGIVQSANSKSSEVSVAERQPQKINTSAQASAAAIPTDIPSGLEPEREDTVTLEIAPKQSLDYRIAMERDYALKYTWKTEGKPLHFEFRGERTGEGGVVEHKIFGKKTGDKATSFFIVPFNGNFGWHWENNSGQPVTIWLNTKGAYKVLGKV